MANETNKAISAMNEEELFAEAKRLLTIVHEYELLCLQGSSRRERQYGRDAVDQLEQIFFELGLRQLAERFKDMIAQHKDVYHATLTGLKNGEEINEGEKDSGRLSWWNC